MAPATVSNIPSRADSNDEHLASFVFAYHTTLGGMVNGRAEDVLGKSGLAELRGRVQLLLTSPPFPLNHKKKYGNLQGQEYVEWLASFAPLFRDTLTADGSIVLELGNAWEPGRPVMSTLAQEALLAFRKAADLELCQQFVCHNPARLPSPAQWVTVERIRVKDSYTHVWWMAATDRPKADNRRVLRPYSSAMKQLLDSKKYNVRKRPSQHHIGPTSFLADNGGAIPPNALDLTADSELENFLQFSNTASADAYHKACRREGLPTHPARMPRGLAEFFIRFLTDDSDLVLDPFAGSNTTGAVAEELGRRWFSVEVDPDYVRSSRGHFPGIILDPSSAALDASAPST
jgi:site-specific DNA-methyltransferase (cytosine-N4-specific)